MARLRKLFRGAFQSAASRESDGAVVSDRPRTLQMRGQRPRPRGQLRHLMVAALLQPEQLHDRMAWDSDARTARAHVAQVKCIAKLAVVEHGN